MAFETLRYEVAGNGVATVTLDQPETRNALSDQVLDELIGVVNRVVPAAELADAVADWAGKLASKSPLMMRLGKDAMFRQQDMAFLEAVDFLRAQLTIAFSTDDIHEGVKAFFEKRDPAWT